MSTNNAASGVEFKSIKVNIDFNGVHVKQGSSAWVYIEMKESDSPGLVRAGIRIVQGASGKHYYRYYKMVQPSGNVIYLENDVEEVEPYNINGSSFSVSEQTQINGSVLYTMYAAGDNTSDPDEINFPGGIGSINADQVNLYVQTYDTETQWFGQATDRLWVKDFIYTSNFGQGTLNPSVVWTEGPYGMSWPQWSENASHDLSFWDTRC